MAGQPGRSGPRPLGAEEHELRGNYRRDRHGPLPGDPALTPAAPGPDWKPTPRDLRSLGREGKAFLLELLAGHQLSAKEGLTALQAARTRDLAARWHARAARPGEVAEQRRSARLGASFDRQFASLLAQLRVRP